MTDRQILNWFEARLVGAALGMTVNPPNSDANPTKPYILLDLVPVEKFNRSLSGGSKISRGFVQITLVHETNEDMDDVLAPSEAIEALFPYGLRHLDALLITRPPLTEHGYRDGPDWRTPIRVDYESYTWP